MKVREGEQQEGTEGAECRGETVIEGREAEGVGEEEGIKEGEGA